MRYQCFMKFHSYQTNQPINYWKSFITCVIFVQSSWNLIWNFISSFSIIWERLVKEWTIILPTSTNNPKFAYSRYGRWGQSYQLGWFAAGCTVGQIEGNLRHETKKRVWLFSSIFFSWVRFVSLAIVCKLTDQKKAIFTPWINPKVGFSGFFEKFTKIGPSLCPSSFPFFIISVT